MYISYFVNYCRGKKELQTIFMIVNIALLSGTTVFYDDSFLPSQRSANISDSSSMFSIPDSFTILPNTSEPLVLCTQPQQLKLLDPAVCNDDYTSCSTSRITLGEGIQIPATILGYNNKPAEFLFNVLIVGTLQ